MSVSDSKKQRVERLKEEAAQRSKAKREAVIAAIKFLVESHRNINVSSVAKQAGVSRAMLHDPRHADLFTQIKKLEQQQPTASKRSAHLNTQERIDSTGLKARNRQLLEANKVLRQENQDLKEEIAVLLGRLTEYNKR